MRQSPNVHGCVTVCGRAIVKSAAAVCLLECFGLPGGRVVKMDARQLLRMQFAQAHGLMDQIIADLDEASLHRSWPGSTLANIAAIYAHAVFAEDTLVNVMIRKAGALYETGGWAARAGVAMPGPVQNLEWGASVRMKLATFREYANEVFKGTDQYILGAPEAELEKDVDTGFAGTQPALQLMGTLGLWHLIDHQGEIAALKGVQGLKGLPF